MSIRSEIDRLVRVYIHRPGPEVEMMTPATASGSLYNDIVPAPEVQREHDALTAVINRYAESVEIRDELSNLLDNPQRRKGLAGELHREDAFCRDILLERWSDATGAAAARDIIEGVTMPPVRLRTVLNGPRYLLPPLPNLYFTRDIAFVVGDTAFAGSMAHDVRRNESIIARLLMGSDDRRVETISTGTIEGGDIMVVSPTLVVAGVGERTTAAAVDALLEVLLRRSDEEVTLLAVELPPGRATIHLDMIVTLIDDGLLLAHEPLVDGNRALPVHVIHGSRRRNWRIEGQEGLRRALGNCGYPVDLVACGGRDERQRDREQWFSGCNSVALAPGKIVVYETNTATLQELEKAGFGVVRPGSTESSEETRRVVYPIPGVELARGGGGPRCMTLPLERRRGG